MRGRSPGRGDLVSAGGPEHLRDAPYLGEKGACSHRQSRASSRRLRFARLSARGDDRLTALPAANMGQNGRDAEIPVQPLNPYQGPREPANEQISCSPDSAARAIRPRCWASINMVAVSLPRWILPFTPGQTVMDGQSSRRLGRQSVSLAEFPSGNACPRCVPLAVHAMRAEPLDSSCLPVSTSRGAARASLCYRGHPAG